jgi:GntR family transcriptional regulator
MVVHKCKEPIKFRHEDGPIRGSMEGFAEGTPIYRQIADRIKADVLRGTLEPDAQIMSTNELASFYRINPATAAKAFRLLVDDGIVYKRRGIGMFVRPEAPGHLRRLHRERFFADLVEPMVAQARTLGIPLSEVIARIRDMEEGGQPEESAPPPSGGGGRGAGKAGSDEPLPEEGT